jgi:hypothetical protein
LVAADSDLIYAYGASYGHNWWLGTVTGAVPSSFDTHHGAEYINIHGGVSLAKQGNGIQCRGRHINWHGVLCASGTDGALLWSEADMDPADYSDDITLHDCTFLGLTDQPFNLRRITNLTLVNPKVTAGAILNVFDCDEAQVTVINGEFTVAGNAAANQSFATLAGGSRLTFLGTQRVTITNHTGATPRMFSMAGDAACVVAVERMDVTANAAFAPTLVLEGASVPCSYYIKETNWNGPTAFATYASGSFTADSYIQFGGTITNPSGVVGGSITDTQVLSFGTSYDQQIVRVCDAAGAVAIGGFAAGKFAGQRVMLWTLTTNNITIPNGTGSNGVEIKTFSGANVVLNAVRDYATFVWSRTFYGWIQDGGQVTP